MMHTPITHCPQCHVKDFIKNGKSGGRQRYKCKSCQYNFTVPKLGKRIDRYYVRLSLRLYLEGLGFRSIERIVGVSHVSVMNWVKKYGKELKALRLCKKESIEAVEVDELHSYVGSKKTTYGSGLLWTGSVNRCWVLQSATGVNKQGSDWAGN